LIDLNLKEEFLGIKEMRCDHLWLSMRKGKNTLEQFEEALRIWKTEHLTVIDLYRKQRDQGEEKQRSLF
jgi:hypothetical protein